MNIYDRIINILIESTFTEGSQGLMRRMRVQKAMDRKLQGNQSQVNPDDPNLQEPGANTPQGKEVYTPSERQSANAKVAQFYKGSAEAEAKRGERIRKRIVQGGQGLRRMAAGIHRGNPLTPAQKAANKEVGGVAKTSPMDVLRQSRERQAGLQQAGGNAASQARGIRHAARNRARAARNLPTKETYSSRAPVGERLPMGESTMNIYERLINMLLEARVEMFIQDRLDESTRYRREMDAGNLSDKSVRRLQSAAKKGKLEAPPETRLGPEFGEPTGRITGLARLKKRAAKAKENKAKGKPYEYNLPKVEPKKLPRGPGKQTGPLETRGIKIKPEKPQKPQRGRK